MNVQQLKAICQAQKEHRPCALLTVLHSHTEQATSMVFSIHHDQNDLVESIDSMIDQSLDTDTIETIKSHLPEWIQNARENKCPAKYQEDSQTYFCEVYEPESRLIVFGGGTIAEHLVRLCDQAGFSITLCDDRIGFANAERFPEAKHIICDSFDDILKQIVLYPNDYVVIITRGHQYDTACLKHALSAKPKYIGMIGSNYRVEQTKKMLQAEGFTAKSLEQLASPIGLKIGSITPFEIAISIVAQLICARRLGQHHPSSTHIKKYKDDTDLNLDEATKLAEKEPSMLIEIIDVKGSSPRGMGAKMVVTKSGRTLGSIGGGCAEGELLQVAKANLCMGQPGDFSYEQVDMTGSVAADEGMACGGIMTVLMTRLS